MNLLNPEQMNILIRLKTQSFWKSLRLDQYQLKPVKLKNI